MKRNNIFSRIVPLLLVCMASDAALLLLYADKRKRHHRVVHSRGVVRRTNPVVPVSQSREMVEHQIMKRQLQELTTMPAAIRIERLPRLLENLQTFPSVKRQDPQLEQQIKQAFRTAQDEIRPPKGAIVQEKSTTQPQGIDTQEKAPENAEQVVTYVTSIVEKETLLKRLEGAQKTAFLTASFFEQLGFPFKKVEDIWLAHKDDPVEKLLKVTASHFHVSKAFNAMVEQQYFGQKENADEIMQVLQEKEAHKARELVTQEISYWLLFDLLQNYEKIDADAIKTVLLPRAVALFTFAFNSAKMRHPSGAIDSIGGQIKAIVNAKVLKEFLKSTPKGTPYTHWIISNKEDFIAQLPAEQQEKMLPLLQEGAQLLEQLETAKKENEQAFGILTQTGFFASQEVVEQREVAHAPPPQKKGMSLGTKIAIGLMGAVVLGGGYMVYQEYAAQKVDNKDVPGAVKSAGKNVIEHFSSAVDGLSGLFGRATTFVKSKFSKNQEGAPQ